MLFDDYFDFLSDDDIRLKGHRLGIESILYEYIHRGQTAEEIARRFPTLTLAQVYASLLYYLENKPAMDRYVADWLEHGQQGRKHQKHRSSTFLDRLRRLKAEQAGRGVPGPIRP